MMVLNIMAKRCCEYIYINLPELSFSLFFAPDSLLDEDSFFFPFPFVSILPTGMMQC